MASSSKDIRKETVIKVDKGDLENHQTQVEEKEIEDGRSDTSLKTPRPSRRRILFTTFTRNLDPSSVGRKKAFWARGLVILAILSLILGLAFL